MSQQINLFNPVFLKQKKYFSVVAMLQALALVAIGSALFYGYAVYQVKALSKQSAESDKRFEAEQNKLTRYAEQFSQQQSSQLLEDKLKQTEARLAAQRRLIGTLKGGALGNTNGYSEYMRAFARQSINGLWLTGFDITGDGMQIRMNGAVLSPELLPAYIQGLAKESVMRGKSFAALQMQQPKASEDKSARFVEFSLQSIETAEAAKK